MKQRIRACRVVLRSGYAIMDYIDKSGSRGIAFAGGVNHNYANLWNCTQEEFEKGIQDWAIKNKDNDDVEYVEFI